MRFGLLAAKAAELCQEVKILGTALLSAIEKQDGEALAALRAGHEVATLQLAETVKYAQWQEAIRSREALESSQEIVRARYTYYERLLGVAAADVTIEDAESLDVAGLETGRFSSTDLELPSRDVGVYIDPSALPAGGGPAEGKKVSRYEAKELEKLDESQTLQGYATNLESLAGLLNAIPLFSVDIKPIGTGAGTTFGGKNLADIASS